MDSHPFSAAYWHMAAGELKNVRKLTFAALCFFTSQRLHFVMFFLRNC